MNKKQRNRKKVKQNQRNRIINRRYSSTIKSLFKLFQSKTNANNSGITETNLNLKNEIIKIQNSLYSVIDKSIKKGVLHKNTGARKKARVAKYFLQKK